MLRTKTAALLLALILGAPVAASAADAPGVFKIPGTESTIKFYGYVQLDSTLDFSGRVDQIEDADWATILPAVPADDSLQAKKKTPQLYWTARTSRFGIQTSTPSSWGPIGVKLEGDFNAPNAFQGQTFTNSMIFRLRHAYGTVGGLLVGQTWSTFLDLNAAPDTVDFNGPGSLALVRNPMIRYTFGIAPNMSLSVAAENAPGTAGLGLSAAPIAQFQTIPDFHANLNYSANWGTVSARLVTNQYKRAQIAGGAYADASPKTAQGFAGALSGSFKVGGDTLVAQFSGGPGVGRYLLNSIGAPFVSFDNAGDMKLWTVFAVHGGYTHVWNPEFRSNLVGAYTWVQDAKINGAETGNGVEKTMVQVFANTFWSFAKSAEFGVEYAYGQWKSFSTTGSPEVKGTQNRINASFHYNFF